MAHFNTSSASGLTTTVAHADGLVAEVLQLPAGAAARQPDGPQVVRLLTPIARDLLRPPGAYCSPEAVGASCCWAL